jgi:hypothetical protein
MHVVDFGFNIFLETYFAKKQAVKTYGRVVPCKK